METRDITLRVERIPANIEKPFRKALGHAIKNEFDDFRETLAPLPDPDLIACVGLCIYTAGYVAIDVCGREWPGEENLRKIAKAAVKSSFARIFGLTEDESYAYIRRAALRFEPLDKVFPNTPKDRDAILLAFAITAHLVAVYRPKGTHWYEFLSKIEEAYEIAQISDLDALPSMMLRSRRERLASARQE